MGTEQASPEHAVLPNITKTEGMGEKQACEGQPARPAAAASMGPEGTQTALPFGLYPEAVSINALLTGFLPITASFSEYRIYGLGRLR